MYREKRALSERDMILFGTLLESYQNAQRLCEKEAHHALLAY